MGRQKTIDEEKELFNYACWYLGRYPSSVIKLKEKLKQKCPDSSIVDSVITRLKSLNYLDDKILAESIVRILIRRGYGRYRIASKLKEKKLHHACNPSVILSGQEMDKKESHIISSLIEKKKSSYKLETISGKKKFADFLIRRGFKPSIVYAILKENNIF